MLLPIHFLANRFYPTIPQSPISSFGPSELDYEFVKLGLQRWPWRSAFLFVGLVGGVLVHASEGTALLWEKYIVKRANSESHREGKRRTKRMGLVSVGAALVLSGVYALSREDLVPIPSLLARMDAVYTKSLFYRL